MTEEEAETIKGGEHSSITYPEGATSCKEVGNYMKVIKEKNIFADIRGGCQLNLICDTSTNLFELWSRINCKPLPVPGKIFLSFFVVVFPCISCTNRLYFDGSRLSFMLKAQHTPESVMTGLKISEQLTSRPCQEHWWSR